MSVNSGDYWHTFTREHNHESFNDNKIIIPMTAKDTIASVISEYGCYMDNSNVWFVSIKNNNIKILKTISLIMNSTVFSVFAKSEANPQSGGYYKFNKQFLIDVPFPTDVIEDTETIELFANLYDEIYNLQLKVSTVPDAMKDIIKSELNKKWSYLDEKVNDLYELSKDEIQIIYDIGRTIDRYDLMGD